MRLLVITILTCVLVSGVAPPAALARPLPAQPAIDTALATRLEQALDQAIAGGAPGAILAVSIPGQLHWSGARGLAERGGAPMTPQHRFRIASITKLFVAVVALQLVQEGWLSLDHTVEHWLPGLLPDGRSITVRQLMGHTSGIRDYMDGRLIARVLADPQRVWAPRELVAYATARGAIFRPGARGRWHYSNTNYVILGMLIERVTRTTLAHEIGFRIIERLDLRDTFFEQGGQPPDRLAHGYDRRRDLTGLNMSFAWAAGNMTSNADDLTRFAQALFGDELLEPQLLGEMSAFGAVEGSGWSRSLSYGLGLMRETLRYQDMALTAYGHTGMLAGYRTALWHDPQRGITVVAIQNLETANPTAIAAQAFAVIRGDESRTTTSRGHNDTKTL